MGMIGLLKKSIRAAEKCTIFSAILEEDIEKGVTVQKRGQCDASILVHALKLLLFPSLITSHGHICRLYSTVASLHLLCDAQLNEFIICR